MFNKNNNGFTLAEVLIAMTCMGILAAILVPVMMHSKPSNNRLLFKKAYYSLENAVTKMINDNNLYPANQVITLDSDGLTYQKGFNYTAPVGNGSVNKFCYYLSQTMNTVGNVTCPTTDQAGMNYLINFTTTDGIVWGIFSWGSDNLTNSETSSNANQLQAVTFPIAQNIYDTRVFLDVNGTKGPNCTLDTHGSDFTPYTLGGTANFNYSADCKNPDRFIIGVRYDGKLRVGKSDFSDETITDQNAIDIISDPTNNK